MCDHEDHSDSLEVRKEPHLEHRMNVKVVVSEDPVIQSAPPAAVVPDTSARESIEAPNRHESILTGAMLRENEPREGLV